MLKNVVLAGAAALTLAACASPAAKDAALTGAPIAWRTMHCVFRSREFGSSSLIRRPVLAATIGNVRVVRARQTTARPDEYQGNHAGRRRLVRDHLDRLSSYRGRRFVCSSRYLTANAWGGASDRTGKCPPGPRNHQRYGDIVRSTAAMNLRVKIIERRIIRQSCPTLWRRATELVSGAADCPS